MKLYADFYEADIIVASPLALATLLADAKGAPRAADFLSSIELCVVDRCDVVLMQNWAHLLTGRLVCLSKAALCKETVQAQAVGPPLIMQLWESHEHRFILQ